MSFAPEHVCGYAYSPRELGYNLETPCFLLKRVAHAGEPPRLLLLNSDGQWEAHAEDESDEELADSGSVLVWSLGYLTDRFPQTQDAVCEGSARRGLLRRKRRDVWWRWQDGRYLRLDD